MTQEQFECEKNYRASIAIAKVMLSKGLINEKEYMKIDTILIERYCPILGSLRVRLT